MNVRFTLLMLSFGFGQPHAKRDIARCSERPDVIARATSDDTCLQALSPPHLPVRQYA